MKVDEAQTSYLDRFPNPFFGAFAGSPIVEAEIKAIHTDEANNVTLTADVVTLKGERKARVPFALPFANRTGTAGIFSVPSVGDRCLVALAAGNSPYIIAYHPTPQLEQGRASASKPGSAFKGKFSSSELLPGAIELKSLRKNRILLHPGGSIAIDARVDLFTFYDAISATIESQARNVTLSTAGGVMVWKEGLEKAQRSHSFFAEMFTKSATKENLEKGELRGGARLRVLFSEVANHFFIEVADKDNITSRIQIGPNGIILTSSHGSNQGSIAVSPSGGFSLIAGDPNGAHTQVDLASNAVAISAFIGSGSPVATVIAETKGEVKISSRLKVTLDAQQVITQGGRTNLGSPGGVGVARFMDTIAGGCPAGSVVGTIVSGSALVTAI